ncbi:hypothetical protein A3H65_02995 [Candidatus Giovannonibacteria bacterium RIFCSPLOWO2_02_FULL_45_14]|uniref:HTH merR-type domain-containing protein n=1 Tax=Candidatus Giovannonibacteria bacterium RIFCSPLOWO2_12_FULL_44_15 TaxID=1798364 RepID=A0A1F5Y034_9BACT|nr:MAG: hypothetical protein A3C75_00970 [Candidatus Giovannonibacteria bacterium RIFCSPHIGHO2_02_FULL_44_31]OGF76392.1 MAG: hypothetical protein A3E62_03200 [Candidatus Giovannonibacteria bacterium RIFCSPHIGHO2_12_FULL_44_29]OGF90879.1 MAG: hypothetical protein A3H65_02995 [Candidatus Giovannonibacteria bacterium RIFCSPLOWO2_02_FULL_45_14]OGF93525.1 MAG: hypothetical protein A3G54_01095 [Candidatus Giovannonibacteria bacterium RIFCSPLOWO2_12_FULL_44_15]
MSKSVSSAYLKIKDAAIFLGVSPETLRSWEKNKKLLCTRDPKNRYRLYKIGILQKFRESRKKKYHKSG